MTKCASCSTKKGKRSCPALNSLICSQCCGTKKKVKINCPDDCYYLKSSQHHDIEKRYPQQIRAFENEMKSIVGKEDAYTNILQDIETSIYRHYQERRTINDRDVETALEFIFETGKSQMDLPSKSLKELPLKTQSLVDTIEDSIKFRESFGNKKELLTKIKCIYRVLDSVRNHFDSNDEYSYMNFIGYFIARKEIM